MPPKAKPVGPYVVFFEKHYGKTTSDLAELKKLFAEENDGKKPTGTLTRLFNARVNPSPPKAKGSKKVKKGKKVKKSPYLELVEKYFEQGCATLKEVKAAYEEEFEKKPHGALTVQYKKYCESNNIDIVMEEAKPKRKRKKKVVEEKKEESDSEEEEEEEKKESDSEVEEEKAEELPKPKPKKTVAQKVAGKVAKQVKMVAKKLIKEAPKAEAEAPKRKEIAVEAVVDMAERIVKALPEIYMVQDIRRKNGVRRLKTKDIENIMDSYLGKTYRKSKYMDLRDQMIQSYVDTHRCCRLIKKSVPILRKFDKTTLTPPLPLDLDPAPIDPVPSVSQHYVLPGPVESDGKLDPEESDCVELTRHEMNESFPLPPIIQDPNDPLDTVIEEENEDDLMAYAYDDNDIKYDGKVLFPEEELEPKNLSSKFDQEDNESEFSSATDKGDININDIQDDEDSDDEDNHGHMTLTQLTNHLDDVAYE